MEEARKVQGDESINATTHHNCRKTIHFNTLRHVQFVDGLVQLRESLNEGNEALKQMTRRRSFT
jgi:hypothetical protein